MPTTTGSGPRRLYLLQLGTADVPLGEGRSLYMSAGCYLVQTGEGNVLIDSGIPPDVPAPGIPPLQHGKNVLEHLADLGLRPADIDILVATHFDVDHVGYHDAFANAELVVQRSHYELARGGHERFASGRAHWDHPALRYRMVDGDAELLPGVTLIETSGHTHGHQSVLVRLPRTGPVLLTIDAVAMERLFTPERPPWPMDEDHELLRASTRKLLDLVEREHVALVVFGHDGAQWRTLDKAPAWYE
jgi:N-acyl homoserine lactone hydrolase